MAADTNDVDPRLTGEADLRPIVAPEKVRPMSGWISAFLLLVMGVALFVMLDARRRAGSALATTPRTVDDSGAPETIAPLFVPRLPPPLAPEAVVPPPILAPEPPAYPPPSPPMTTPIVRPPPFPFLHPPPSQRNSDDPVLVVDTPEDEAAPGTAPPVGTSGTDEAGASGSTAGAASPVGAVVSTRVGATLMHHRATTVPQGTLIPAVLETALDSTRSGLTRALVSTDVRGFDGSRVLIPRGSRLIGEYRADVQSGQNRALVTWTRLIRPDGVTIAIGSPAADPLGRIGIKGSVDSHFLAKFGSAILQSALDIGVNLASHAGGGETTVLALPNSTQVGSSSLVGNTQVQPTLRVREGAAIDVFVARDLDFTAVEIAQ